MNDLNARMDDMLARYGEVCNKTVAARILGRSVNTVKAMVRDGRLDAACAGAMVDVRSIARYICQPEEAEEAARVRRYKARRGSGWAV